MNRIDNSIVNNGPFRDVSFFSGITSTLETWEEMDDSNSSQRIDPNTWASHSDISGPSLSITSPFNFNDWIAASNSNDKMLPDTSFQGHMSTSQSPSMLYSPSNKAPIAHSAIRNPVQPESQPPSHQNSVDYSMATNTASAQATDTKFHHCSREAYTILGRLSFLDPGQLNSTPSSGPASPSTAGSHPSRVPLDLVLRLNCETMEQLEPLLACPCAKSTANLLLHASIISKIMLWYQQAAGCAESTSILSATPAGVFGTGSGTSTPPLAHSTEVAVEPARMVIGTFNVDDQNIQTALKIQLLSGEMKKAGRLIDQLTSYNCDTQNPVQESGATDVNGLDKCLDSWLRVEQTRIVNMMRSKLWELEA
ncbi:hypothetical protein PT974_11073 [Cladobotryum mycophilum]|uniref:Aflatoxin regulatory protein domain-containing protein n=1 Tax=Cladobotryum mycophilum TaxID=491253 RepID=A0ABR0SBJ4_9HYPO